ncbi:MULTISPECIES: TetR/AcrR family transcriptional regulator [unclassified Streptomyces]|uniref:TetR/AcrR family transcriptional regulator n=1 Tax=unclassified Streptomyces TaxID=2593676 RepID=UPI003D8A9971
MRADAQRNYEALVAAAREAFAEHGADAALDDIARRANVGIGTLYRHFPQRDELLAAVYVADIEALSAHARELAEDLPPGEALTAFLRLFMQKLGLQHAAIKQVLKVTRSDTYNRCRSLLREAGDTVITRAQDAGVIRRDLDPWTVLRLVHGVALAGESAPETTDLMLSVVLDGLRPTNPGLQ